MVLSSYHLTHIVQDLLELREHKWVARYAVAALLSLDKYARMQIYFLCIDIIFRYASRNINTGCERERSRINCRSACLEAVHVMMATVASSIILNNLDAMIGLLRMVSKSQPMMFGPSSVFVIKVSLNNGIHLLFF